MGKQITVRNVTPELDEALKKLSEERNESVNLTVLRILGHALGINERRSHLLRRYVTWNQHDAQEFDEALGDQRVVDEADWS